MSDADAVPPPPSAVEDIVTFSSPPVAEVMASVQFAPMQLPNFLTSGTLWRERMMLQFPTVQQQPRYEVPTETFPAVAPTPQFSIQLPPMSTLPRVWFSDASGEELIQLQADWFAVNWRKVDPNSQYGRWPSRRDAFISAWQQVSSWFRALGEDLTPQQVEVTYINHIAPMDGLWSSHADAANVFATQVPALGGWQDERLPKPERFSSNSSFIIPGDRGEPVGRLHVSIQPAFRSADDVPVIAMELTARCQVPSGDDGAIFDTLDRGRNAVVRSFVALTSEHAQTAWGIQ